MAKKAKRISRPVKQKFSPGIFYLILSLVVLILIAFFVNTSKISKEPQAKTDCKPKYPDSIYAACSTSSTTTQCMNKVTIWDKKAKKFRSIKVLKGIECNSKKSQVFNCCYSEEKK